MPKVKISITLEGEYAQAVPQDLRAFAEQSPEFKDMVHGLIHIEILKLRTNDTQKSLTHRKVLAIGCSILRHIDSLEVTEIEP